MAVGRSLNVKGQMRIDVPHLRLIESGVVYDFDTLAGGILAGKLPYVVTGFVPAAWVNGSPASSLSLVTADSIFVNYQASENGSMLMVPADRVPEQLTITNSRVSGSFTVSQTNYVSLDLTKTEDDATSDVVHFIDPATGQGTPKIIPLGRTMDYQIHITTAPFSTTPQRCPVMIVVTDATNNIVSVTDARPMMYRLASGGDTPNVLAKYAWPQGRSETPNTFVGGDKAINSMKDWVSALEEMIWQINAGEYWYSNTQMTSTWFMPGAITNWTWNGTTLTWASPLTIVFTGSTAITNTVAAGSINLTAGNAAYVDFNRYTDGAVLTVYQAAIQTMGGEPATPGIRYPFAWRLAAGSPAIRNLPVPAGSSVVGMATTTVAGSVFINTASATPYAVISDMLNGTAIANGLTRSTAGQIAIGGRANDTSVVIGNISTNTASTLYSAGTITLATVSTGGTYYIGRYLGFASTSTINIGSTDVGSYTINIGASTDSSGGIYRIGTGLTTGNTNNIYIGQGHAGTGASGIQIGQAGRGTLGLYSANLYINDAGTAPSTYIGASASGLVQVRGTTININDAGASCDTLIGHSGAGTSTTILSETVDINWLNDAMTLRLGSGGTIGTNIWLGTSGAAGAASNIFVGFNGTSNSVQLIAHNLRINADSPPSGTVTLIGTPSIREVDIYGLNVNINTSGASTTTIGHSGASTISNVYGRTIYIGELVASQALTVTVGNYYAGSITYMYGQGVIMSNGSDTSVGIVGNLGEVNISATKATTGAINLAATGTGGIMRLTSGSGGVNINTTGTGPTVIGNATSKASAAAATLVSDPALTLVTLGYLTGNFLTAGAWLAPQLGFWETTSFGGGASQAFRMKARGSTSAGYVAHLRGVFDAGATPVAAFVGTLESQWWPNQAMYFSTHAQDAGGTAQYPAMVSILTDGKVYGWYMPTIGGAWTTPIADMQIFTDGICYPIGT